VPAGATTTNKTTSRVRNLLTSSSGSDQILGVEILLRARRFMSIELTFRMTNAGRAPGTRSHDRWKRQHSLPKPPNLTRLSQQPSRKNPREDVRGLSHQSSQNERRCGLLFTRPRTAPLRRPPDETKSGHERTTSQPRILYCLLRHPSRAMGCLKKDHIICVSTDLGCGVSHPPPQPQKRSC